MKEGQVFQRSMLSHTLVNETYEVGEMVGGSSEYRHNNLIPVHSRCVVVLSSPVKAVSERIVMVWRQ